MSIEALQIERCRKLIEEKLGWGDSRSWQSADFDNLSDKIFKETGSLVSSSTLKRIWGKVKYDSKPNVATLNVLTRFIGFENWRAFMSASSQMVAEQVPKTGIKPAQKLLLKWLLTGATVALIVIVFLSLYRKHDSALNIGDVSFSCKTVTSGVPNTVVFQYDASGSNADSVFIQQSWDQRLRARVDKKSHEYARTYYIPGYYKAKLVLNDSIVKEQDVYIETNGWIGLIETKPIPVYLQKSDYEHGDQMGITGQVLKDEKINSRSEPFFFTLTKVDKKITVAGQRFTLNAVFQNTSDDNSKGICRETHISVLGTEGLIDIPFCKKGCVGSIGIMLGMKYVSGKTTDLSGLGIDFENPVKVQCDVDDGRIKVLVNGETGYEGECSNNIGRIVGYRISFMGTGVLKSFYCSDL